MVSEGFHKINNIWPLYILFTNISFFSISLCSSFEKLTEESDVESGE